MCLGSCPQTWAHVLQEDIEEVLEKLNMHCECMTGPAGKVAGCAVLAFVQALLPCSAVLLACSQVPAHFAFSFLCSRSFRSLASCMITGGYHARRYLAHGTAMDYMFNSLHVPYALTMEVQCPGMPARACCITLPASSVA